MKTATAIIIELLVACTDIPVWMRSKTVFKRSPDAGLPVGRLSKVHIADASAVNDFLHFDNLPYQQQQSIVQGTKTVVQAPSFVFMVLFLLVLRATFYVKCVGYSEGFLPPACVDSQEA